MAALVRPMNLRFPHLVTFLLFSYHVLRPPKAPLDLRVECAATGGLVGRVLQLLGTPPSPPNLLGGLCSAQTGFDR